ncbi:hypothetical protein Presley_5 [Acinetobacter phage Presley]|uniref:Uncharacterized protein n=1 Tax=Acinetobacter phage Presley TaxID=1406780 RepID=U5PZL2_9CAUD|nr:hypothetical protein Presley_5 [Acinetobacter phage Presley]AGY48072.1 hypothetical protein Presley_5 [Acinetobacter phage Presley]
MKLTPIDHIDLANSKYVLVIMDGKGMPLINIRNQRMKDMLRKIIIRHTKDGSKFEIYQVTRN